MASREKAGNIALGVLHPAKAIQVRAEQKAAAEGLKAARDLRRENLGIVDQLNWEPDYVSDLVKPYQKAQSPVARSFLESLLTGANPSMVSSTRHGGDRLRAGAQARFDDQFGGWDALLARQREVERQTPWAPNTYGGAPAVHKLPPPAPEPAWMGQVRADPNGRTPEGAAALQQMWGFDEDYWKRLEEAVGHPVDRTLGRG